MVLKNVFIIVLALLSAAPAFCASPRALTFMVYKNAKNDLWEFAEKDMAELRATGSDAAVNVVTEVGRMKDGGDWSGVRRYYVESAPADAPDSSGLVWEAPFADMGDWRHLADFIKWAKANYPARRYALVVWNHGNGWKKGLPGRPSDRAISFDDETGSHITTPQLAAALRESGPVDVLAFDACLMQTVEVAYEVKDYAAVVVGSEETEPGEGYPYDMVVNALKNSPAASPEEIGAVIVREYQKANAAAYMNTTQSALRTAALPDLLELLVEWTAEAARAEPMALKYAASRAQAFYDFDQKDLYDYMRGVSGLDVSEELRVRSCRIMSHLKDAVIVSNGITGYQHSDARGLAIYLPQRYAYSADYGALAWSRNGHWDEFISGALR
ncbi:MAG: clostripain-related cysteine peptidase [Elusimicrobiales bacterium]